MSQPITSRIAHDKVKSSGQKESHWKLIHAALSSLPRKMGTATDIAIRSKLSYWEVCRRTSELVRMGMIEVISKRGGKTKSGNPCMVYRALPIEADEEVVEASNNVQLGLFGKVG